ncbi:MAG: hypothetical protein RLZZ157_861 [Pseudomonadota bacterium]
MSDLLREAEDEMRKETAENAVKRAAPFVIGAVLLSLAGGAGWQFYQAQLVERGEKASVAYDKAMAKLQSGDLDGGAKALAELAKTAPQGFAAQAKLQQGAVLQEQGKAAEARVIFEEAAKSIKDPDLADLAALRAAYIAADSETREQLGKRLAPIIDKKGAFSALARELVAARAWEAGDVKAARAAYGVLQLDLNAPEGVRARAGQAIAVIDAAAEKSKTPMTIQQQGGPEQNQGQPSPEQLAQVQAQMQAAPAASATSGEGTPQSPRIVRLPPGVKLPPGTKLPPNVRVIETPLPKGAKPPQGAQGQVQQVSGQVMDEIERERQASMARQKAVTEAQQKQIQEIERARLAAEKAAKAVPVPPIPEKAPDAGGEPAPKAGDGQ